MVTLFGETPSPEQMESASRNAVRTFLRAYACHVNDSNRPNPPLSIVG